jgi:hypothetical protein
MTFINGVVVDEEREPGVMRTDGVISEDVQRDFDIIWDGCPEVCEVL